MKRTVRLLLCFLVLGQLESSLNLLMAQESKKIHVWEMQEVVLQAEKQYANYYTEVTCWVDLKGPGFSKRVYAFWDGGNTYKVRIVATGAGTWEWKSGSNQTDDSGLNNHTGSFEAVNWTDQELNANPNRRGFIRPTPNGHALQYADGTPFLMVGRYLAGRHNLALAVQGYYPGC